MVNKKNIYRESEDSILLKLNMLESASALGATSACCRPVIIVTEISRVIYHAANTAFLNN